MLDRLSNQQPIEWVAVEWREASQVRHRPLIHRQGGYPVGSPLLRQVLGWRVGKWELAQATLDDRLPN